MVSASDAGRGGGAAGTHALPRGPTGPYQVQAAIAAIHDEAPSSDATDWPQILALYQVLLGLSDNPVVKLNHAVAAATVKDRRQGSTCSGSSRLIRDSPTDRRLHAVRAHLLELAGYRAAARDAYLAAARRSTSLQHQRYLHSRARRIDEH